MIRGINKQMIFQDDEDYKTFLGVLKECKKKSGFSLYAYCLMDNHIHLLIRENGEGISTIMKRIGCKFVYWYNMKYERVGHLFQDRFRSEPVESDEYFLTVLRYIHQNPVKANLVKECGEYPYSSYKLYFIDSILIDKDYTLSMISLNQYRDMHKKQETSVCLDIEESDTKMNDNKAQLLFESISGCKSKEEIQEQTKQDRKQIIIQLRKAGLSIRQISQVSGLARGRVERIIYKK